jgi:hypothetical protein
VNALFGYLAEQGVAFSVLAGVLYGNFTAEDAEDAERIQLNFKPENRVNRAGTSAGASQAAGSVCYLF